MNVLLAPAFSLIALLAGLAPACADDFGPTHDVAAIRRAVPILLAYRVRPHSKGDAVVVDDVVAYDWNAAAAWHAGDEKGVMHLTLKGSGWWFSAGTTFDPAAGYWVEGFPGEPYGCNTGSRSLSQGDLHRLGFTDDFLKVARVHLAALRWLWQWPQQPTAEIESCDYRYRPGAFDIRDRTDEYDGRLTGKTNVGLSFGQHAPSIVAVPPNAAPGAIYFFQLAAQASRNSPVTDAKLDVWFPFVLNSAAHYELWLGLSDPELHGIRGTLRDNVLHFALPRFSLRPGRAALGEIVATLRLRAPRSAQGGNH